MDILIGIYPQLYIHLQKRVNTNQNIHLQKRYTDWYLPSAVELVEILKFTQLDINEGTSHYKPFNGDSRINSYCWASNIWKESDDYSRLASAWYYGSNCSSNTGCWGTRDTDFFWAIPTRKF